MTSSLRPVFHGHDIDLEVVYVWIEKQVPRFVYGNTSRDTSECRLGFVVVSRVIRGR